MISLSVAEEGGHFCSIARNTACSLLITFLVDLI